MSDVREVIIIGGGPAGYTAALYAARANLKPLVIEGFNWGGQLMITSDVENYPGYPEGVMGPEMMAEFRRQAERFDVDFVTDDVTRVDFSERPFRIWIESEEYRANAVIIATGASARWLGLHGEQRLQGRGVSACATCDGAFFKDRELLVVGGGDTAMEEATYLTRLCFEVVVVHRRHELRASKIMQERALKNPKIKFIWDSEVAEVLGTDAPQHKITGVKLRHLKTGAISEHPIDGLFIAIGHQPNTAFLKGQLPMDARGYLAIEPGSSRTKVAGVFAAGDVADATYRQAVTAAGSGCMAAMDAERWLHDEAHRAQAEPPAIARAKG
jgi:thioredoxin reductase (NADPH)